MSEEVIPEEFKKVIKDFVRDIRTTFPEYDQFVQKWWKDADYFASMENEKEREEIIEKTEKNNMKFIFKFCMKRYPPRFFDILYQNADIFKEDSETDTEFLPYIHFKNLWQCDISDKTRETIWKYLQLILFSITGSLNNKEAFGDTSKLFEAINEDDFKGKLEEVLNGMQDIFKDHRAEGEGEGERQSEEGDRQQNFQGMPNADDIHEHISGMMNGKLGKLAKEIAEETAADFNMDMDGATNVQDVFQKMMKNPAKLMDLVKNVGTKLETRMKSGDIKESELLAEASEMINKMKAMPGMGNIREMLAKMGMGGLAKGGKLDLNAMEAKLNQTMKTAKMKERMRQKLDEKRAAGAAAAQVPVQPSPANTMTDDALFAFIEGTNKNTSSNDKKSEKKSNKKGKK
jgi:hypothetical protein